MVDYRVIEERWNVDEKSYQKLGKLVKKVLEDEIFSSEMYAEVTFRTKELLSMFKKLRKRSDLSYETLTDKLGARIICHYKQDILMIDPIIRRIFEVEKWEDKAEKLPHDVFAYTSYHYDLIYPKCSDADLRNFVFELQLRTINQHAWACTAHELSYKQEIDLTKPLRRKVHRLSALYEIADDELSQVNSYVLEHRDFPVFRLLKALEGKFYRYAKLGYDKEMSFDTLEKVLKFIPENKVKEFVNSKDNWFATNGERIAGIFSEYKNSSYKGYLILQPETLLFWYFLEREFYLLKDNWIDHFAEEDFEQIRSAWAKID